MKQVRTLMFAACMATMPITLVAQATISFPDEYPHGGISCWAIGLNPCSSFFSVIGQTFAAPASPNTLLQDLSFYFFNAGLDSDIFYRLYLYGWNQDLTTPFGTSLFESDVLHIGPTPEATQVTVSTGGVSLTPDQMFIFFLEAQSGSGHQSLRVHNHDPYAGGALAYITRSTGEWHYPGDHELYGKYDLAFTASFADPNVVPEPVTVILLGTGLLGIGAARLRRRKERDAEG